MLTTVIKLGGTESEDPVFLRRFAQELRTLKNQRIVLVHGGGRMMTQYQEQAGIALRKIDGLRVTCSETLKIAENVLWGMINAEIVGVLCNYGIKAVGVAGHYGGLIQARKLEREDGQDLGFVGEVRNVATRSLDIFMDLGQIPVIAPLGSDEDGQAYNINADSAALAIALGLGAHSLRFVTNVPGVLKEGRLVPSLNASTAEGLIQEGVIQGGMLPKVRSALQARAAGVPQVWITQDSMGGTVFT